MVLALHTKQESLIHKFFSTKENRGQKKMDGRPCETTLEQSAY